MDGVVATVAPNQVDAFGIGDGVVTVAAVQKIVAIAAFDGVVAAVAPHGVVATQGVDAFGHVGATDHLAGVAFERCGVVGAEDPACIQVLARVAIKGPAGVVTAHPAGLVDFDGIALGIQHGGGVAQERGQGAVGLCRGAGRADLDGLVGH